jgi:hypothetical protein
VRLKDGKLHKDEMNDPEVRIAARETQRKIVEQLLKEGDR